MSALESLGTDLLIEQTPDGPDYWRICLPHEWSSLPAATPEDTGRCPHCALAFDGRHNGHARYLTLQARLRVQG